MIPASSVVSFGARAIVEVIFIGWHGPLCQSSSLSVSVIQSVSQSTSEIPVD
jgi:hypothetical protein